MTSPTPDRFKAGAREMAISLGRDYPDVVDRIAAYAAQVDAEATERAAEILIAEAARLRSLTHVGDRKITRSEASSDRADAVELDRFASAIRAASKGE